MRTNIEIDDDLFKQVLASGRYKTKKEAVLEGLRLLLKLDKQLELTKLRGVVKWDGNLDKLRRSSSLVRK